MVYRLPNSVRRKFELNPDEVRNNPVYHGVYFGHSLPGPEGGRITPKEFLHAPIIHVGSREQAFQIVIPADTYMDDHSVWNPNAKYPGIFKLNFSQFTEFHPKVVSDVIANRIHAEKLDELGLNPSIGVEGSSNYSRNLTPEERRIHRDAMESFNQNKVLAYWNEHEVPLDRMGGYRFDANPAEHVSFLVPSPIMNLRQAGRRRDPLVQPTLPMDFVGKVSEGAITKSMRKESGR